MPPPCPPQLQARVKAVALHCSLDGSPHWGDVPFESDTTGTYSPAMLMAPGSYEGLLRLTLHSGGEEWAPLPVAGLLPVAPPNDKNRRFTVVAVLL